MKCPLCLTEVVLVKENPKFTSQKECPKCHWLQNYPLLDEKNDVAVNFDEDYELLSTRCPKCKATLIHQDGCSICPECGYSKCSL